MAHLHFEQLMQVPLDEVFAFHANPYNLLKITPPALGMKVTNKEPVIMAEGAEITYQIRWLGIPLNWRTIITCYDPPRSFTDVQAKGPYKKWIHTHTFISEGTATRIIDDVEYELPLGILGEIVAGRLIRRQLNQIFSYRSAILANLISDQKEP